jgi:phage baseplate assembly protein W
MATTQKTPRYSDFTMQFIAHPVTNDLARVTDVESVKRAVRMLVLTDKYERLLDPPCGCNLHRMLFEPLDATTSLVIQNYIRETIENYEPRAILQEVTCVPDYDHNAFIVNITFAVTFAQEIASVSIFLNRVR